MYCTAEWHGFGFRLAVPPWHSSVAARTGRGDFIPTSTHYERSIRGIWRKKRAGNVVGALQVGDQRLYLTLVQ